MKIALVHDYIKEYGGAERVLETLHEIWPKAPVFTTVYLPKFLGPHRCRFKNWDIRSSWLQRIPFIHKLISPIRVITPWVIENWDFSKFDVVIVSATGAYFSNLIVTRADALHVCYCHTPPRYLYGYKTARDWKRHLVGRIIGEYVNHSLRKTDFLSYQRPDCFIANSKEVKRRIWKFYRREASVIYPPVSLVDKLSVKGKEKSEKKSISSPSHATLNAKRYYLAGGRLARAKNIDLAIKACNKLGVKLKVFGKGFAGYEEELKKIAGPKTEFLGEVTDEELIEFYHNAKALIYPSEDEDFGIMPVEAQACGTPVIAYRSGGVLESVVEGKTGVFFDDLTVESLAKEIKSFDKLRMNNQAINPVDCIKNSKRFTKDRFKQEIKKFVEKHYEADN